MLHEKKPNHHFPTNKSFARLSEPPTKPNFNIKDTMLQNIPAGSGFVETYFESFNSTKLSSRYLFQNLSLYFREDHLISWS